jgi:hypothetical protein
MIPRYDRWPQTIECRKCGVEYAAPTRAEMHDSAGPLSPLCDPCQAKADFFANLQNARWERQMRRLAGRVPA